jgi:two-component system LytT family response regulator
MKALIIEDEMMAAQSLQKLLAKVSPDTEVLCVLETVEESVEWLTSHPMPDLLFMDIHLADGSSFAIFDKVDVTAPVIFTTAYDEYALKAFEVNSIDYLLKPIHKGDLERALRKFENLTVPRTTSGVDVKSLYAQIEAMRPKYKSYFLLPERDKLIPLQVSSIAFICIDEKMIKIVTLDHKVFYTNQTLDDLLEQLDPTQFFRANRQYIVSRGAIKDVSIWFGNKLAINLIVETPDKVIVSKARVSEFKTWFSE